MFLRCFLTFAKSQTNVSYKNVSYKKNVLHFVFMLSQSSEIGKYKIYADEKPTFL